MHSGDKHVAPNEITDRAATVRRAWSLDERLSRTGLPPDMPIQLLNYFGQRSPRGFADSERPQSEKARPLSRFESATSAKCRRN